MKQMKRRLLSLLMAFAILCTMIPAAFAVDETPGETEETPPPTVEQPEETPTPGDEETGHEHRWDSGEVTQKPTCKDKGIKVLHCTVEGCTVTKEEEIPVDPEAHKWSDWETVTAATCEKAGQEKRSCELCNKEETRTIEALEHDWQYKYYSSTQHYRWCKNCQTEKDAELTNHLSELTTCPCGYSAKATLSVSKKNNVGKYDYDENITLSVNVSVKNGEINSTEDYTFTYEWDGNYIGGKTDEKVDLNTTRAYCEVSCTVTAYDRKTGAKLDSKSVSWEAELDDTISVDATVYNTSTGYALGDEDDEGDTSVVDQIWDAIDDLTDGARELRYVEFTSVSHSHGDLDASKGKAYYYDDNLEDVTFTPDDDYEGDVSFSFVACDDKKNEYSGTITFDVKEGAASAGDVIYTAVVDDDVDLDVSDFEDFWEDEYSKGTLEYVTFEKVNSRYGALVDGDGDKLSSGDKCYVDAKSKQVGLDEVTFEPKKGYTGAVTIGFTAHGTTSSSSKSTKDLGGTLVILYTENEPKAITYSVTGDAVTLDGDDFLDNYKDAMGSSASSLQVKFLDVPTNGTLYYNYNEKTGKGTELTSKNIGTYTFSTSSRASRSLEDVTYVPDSKGRSDTVKFACYTSGGDLRYYGEVTFGVTVKDVTVSLTSTSSGVTFNSADFFGVSSDMLSVTYLTFGAPSSGTLYKNWTGVTGTKVTTSDKFAYVSSISGYTSLGTVTYVPAAGYSGTVTIPFSAYTTGGTVISGKVSIKVTATATVSFTDVPTTGSQAWAYPYINRLASAGVVGGITPTTYGPKQQVKWGEVLKMVLLGAGHPTQVEGTGANWAANYLTYAYQKGIVSSNKIDLSKPITRLEMAELAAKALGLSAESSIKTGIIGPTDTTNGYVYALYNRGIVGGDSSSGKNLYNPNSTLLRDEMAKIVCGVMDNA